MSALVYATSTCIIRFFPFELEWSEYIKEKNDFSLAENRCKEGQLSRDLGPFKH